MTAMRNQKVILWPPGVLLLFQTRTTYSCSFSYYKVSAMLWLPNDLTKDKGLPAFILLTFKTLTQIHLFPFSKVFYLIVLFRNTEQTETPYKSLKNHFCLLLNIFRIFVYRCLQNRLSAVLHT